MGQSGSLVGKKLGILLVSEALGTQEVNGKKYRIYKCICDCGKVIELPSSQLSSKRKSCGCLKKLAGLRNKKGTPRDYSARTVWRLNYKNGCSLEKFLELSQQNCFYCGRPPSNHSNFRVGGSEEWKNEALFIYNGLDRIDSSQTHTENNIVPCCKTCNWMKNKSILSDFVSHIKKIYKHLNLDLTNGENDR